MSTTQSTVTYFHNVDLDGGVFGYQPSHKLVYVGSLPVPTGTVSPLEWAFRAFNRVDIDVPVLDDNEAPSMSVGDVVVLTTDHAMTWHAVASFGFDDIDGNAVVTIDRDGRTVAQVSRAARDAQRAAERAQVATS